MRTWMPPTLLALLALALMLAGATVARPGLDVAADDPAASRALVRLHGLERNETDAYRWSEPLAGVFLYGYDGRPAVITLRLAAPRPTGVPPATARARSAGIELGRFGLASSWRRYQILAPTQRAGETALLLETTAFTPADDPRELGFALSRARAKAAGPGGLQPVRALYLMALPALGWLAMRRLRAPTWAGWAVGVALAGAAGWAAAAPTASGYLLPTLGWPWWPLVPLLLLIFWPRIVPALGAARAWVDARPLMGWAGLAMALVALGLMRLGLPWPLGMTALVLGVWAAMGLAGDWAGPFAGERTPWPAPTAADGGAALVRLGRNALLDSDDRRLTTDDGRAGLRRSSVVYGQSSQPGRDFRLAVLVGVLAMALLLRLVDLGGQPAGLWRDESRHGLQALQIWNDRSYRPIYVVTGADLPALLFYLMAPVVGLLGPEAWTARLVSALAGALTSLAVYWAAVPLLGRRAALVAAALLAWASWSLSMSRWAFPATLDHLLTLTAVGLVWRCLGDGPQTSDEGLKPSSEPGDAGTALRPAPAGLASLFLRLAPMAGMALAGLLGGLAVYAYHTGRVAPLALAAVAAIRLGARPAAWRRALPGLAAAALVGGLTIAPLAAFILGDLDGYNRRVGSVSILDSNDPTVHSPLGLTLENLGRYALAYHVAGDRNGRHHMPGAPLLDPAAGLLAALGLALALGRARRDPGAAAALAVGAIYLIPGAFSGNAPHAMRSLGTLAPALMLAGLALGALAAGRRQAPALIGAALAASLAFNGWLYFDAMRKAPEVYSEFDLLETTMGRVARAPATARDPELRAVRVFLPSKTLGEDTVRFLTWGLPVGAYTGEPLPPDGPAIIVLPASASAAAQAEALAALGPGATALGPTALLPGTDEPVALAFGRGEAAARLLASAVGTP